MRIIFIDSLEGLILECIYEKDKLNGFCSSWDNEGIIIYQRTYKNDKLIK
jgi:antitoxin component YwqK of YwqJK toxin-antitoxin module